MSPPVACHDRRRYHVQHVCGFPLLAYPYNLGKIKKVGFAAERDHLLPAVEYGQTVIRCPECSGDLRMSWSEFEEQLGAAFKP